MALQQTSRDAPWESDAPSSQRRRVRQRDRLYIRKQQERTADGSSDQRLATFLGWFSIGLGLAEVIAPERFGKAVGGTGEHTAFIRYGCGLREIAAGIGILSQRDPTFWLWARAAGDALDMAALDAAFLSRNTNRARLGAAIAAVAGAAALDIYAAQRHSVPAGENGKMVAVHTETIARSPQDVYRFWRDFENLPRFTAHLESVGVLSDTRSHWVARAPAGRTVEWDAEITEDRPHEMIAWRSLEGADVEQYGTVLFDPAPGNRGTEVRVTIEYSPPAGALGAAVASLFGEAPEQQIKGDLRRLKQVLETGEVIHSDASIHRGPHPARPTADEDGGSQS